MRDTTPPPNRSGGNKGILFLFIGGAIILIAAGVILFKRRADPPPPPPPPPKIEQTQQAPPPLVIAQPTRPIAKPKDAGVKKTVKKKVRRKKRQRPPEKIGTINTKEVNRFMNARFGQVKSCYEHRLKTNSFLEGKLDLNIGIAPSGKVTGVTVNSDTVRDQKMLACIKRAIRKWNFPKPQNGRVVIGKTFNFKKKHR